MSEQTPPHNAKQSSNCEDGVPCVDFNYVDARGSALIYIRQFQSGSWVRMAKMGESLSSVTFPNTVPNSIQ